MFFNKTLMITGDTEPFAHAVRSCFFDSGVKEIRIFSRDEKANEDRRISTHLRTRAPTAWMKVFLIMRGRKAKRVIDTVCIEANQDNAFRIVPDYEGGAVSKKVQGVVMSYVDFVNLAVWWK